MAVAREDLYSVHAALIETVLAHSCRAHRLPADAADEFSSWARLRLLDHDQAILHKFGGRSQLRTYLVTVIERLFLDWRNHEWGKWRPSGEARRLGAVAIELERLVLRDHYTLDEAAATLAANGTASSLAECHQVWTRLPRRPRRQRVEEEHLEHLPAARQADAVEEDEQQQRARVVHQALESAIAALAPADQTVLRLRYWSGFTVARIAQLTGDDQKLLYRRYQRIWAELKRALEAAGVAAEDVERTAGWLDDEGGGRDE